MTNDEVASTDDERVGVLAVVGSASTSDPSLLDAAHEVGRLTIDAGLRLVTGGRGGVMDAAAHGARSSTAWREGRIVAVIPSYDRGSVTAPCDIIIPTGMQLARNIVVVAMADVVVALGGGAGTLSEMALAWQIGKPIVALGAHGGWAEELGERRLDHRHPDPVVRVTTPGEAIERATQALRGPRREPGEIGSGWQTS